MQLKAKVRLSIEAARLLDAIDRKRSKVLQRTGAYGRSVMRRSIRPPKGSKKARSVAVGGRIYIVPVRGMVVDAKTRQAVTTEQAKRAREEFSRQHRGEGVGQPPRRGPSDLLRKGILWSIDAQAQSVVIGAEPFAKQPTLFGAVSVPQLLNYGGGQMIGGVLAKYQARPFVEPALGVTLRKMEQEIEKVPL